MTEQKHTLTIGGQLPRLDNMDELIAQLKKLPSAYQERRRVYTTGPKLDTEKSAAGREMIAGLHTGNAIASAGHYKTAAKLFADEGNFFAQARALGRAGNQLLLCIPPYVNQQNPPPAEAAALFKTAIQLYETAEHFDSAFNMCCSLYTAQCHMLTHYQSIGNPQRADEILTELAHIRAQARDLRNQMYGGVDPDAHRVEEGEIGFSAEEKIGTDLISHCVTILARNPQTHKTAVAHIDYQIDIQSIDQLFEGLGDGKIEMRLIGASHTESNHSKDNLKKVMHYLADKNVDIISADILQGPSAPANAVVNPHDFSVEEKIPGYHTVNAGIGNALLSFCKDRKPLEVQFDFTKSKERAPIFLTREALGDIREHFEHKSEAEIEKFMHDLHYHDLPLIVDDKLQLVSAYQKEWHALQATLERAIQTQGADDENAGRARAELEKRRFFIGENAEAKNAAIHDWLENKLLVNGKFQFAATENIERDSNIYRLPTYAAQVSRSKNASIDRA